MSADTRRQRQRDAILAAATAGDHAKATALLAEHLLEFGDDTIVLRPSGGPERELGAAAVVDCRYGQDVADPIEVRETDEGWARVTDDEDVRGVEVSRRDDGGEWPLEVFVSAAEFVRVEPLESRLRAAVGDAIRGVPGVEAVAEEDREIWIVQGSPDLPTLTRAVAAAIDELAEDIEAVLEAD